MRLKFYLLLFARTELSLTNNTTNAIIIAMYVMQRTYNIVINKTHFLNVRFTHSLKHFLSAKCAVPRDSKRLLKVFAMFPYEFRSFSYNMVNQRKHCFIHYSS